MEILKFQFDVPRQTITEDDLREMLGEYEDVPFTASNLLEYLNRKNRQALLIEKYSL